MSSNDYSLDQRRQKRAEKEIEESTILVDYLLAFDKDFNNIANFTSKAVKAAIEWTKNKNVQ